LYNIIADYHTHTIYSHGKGTILDNVNAAREKGLRRIAITDHGFSHIGFGLDKSSLKKMKDEIKQLNEMFEDIEVLLGIESNLIGMDGEIDIPEGLLDSFDIILMGFHKAVWPHSLKDGWDLFARNALAAMRTGANERLRHANTMAMIRAIERYPIDIITHPGAKIDIDTKELARAAVKRNVALEINASHGFMTADYARVAKEEGALIVISSDAHTPDRVGVMDRGLEIAKAAGLPPEKIINTKEYDELKRNWK